MHERPLRRLNPCITRHEGYYVRLRQILTFTHLHAHSPTSTLAYPPPPSLTHLHAHSPTSTLAHPPPRSLTHLHAHAMTLGSRCVYGARGTGGFHPGASPWCDLEYVFTFSTASFVSPLINRRMAANPTQHGHVINFPPNPGPCFARLPLRLVSCRV